jgi:hypothetical protein
MRRRKKIKWDTIYRREVHYWYYNTIMTTSSRTWETLKPLFPIHRDRSNREELDAASCCSYHRKVMIRQRGISNHLITQMRKSEKAWRKKDSENIPARMMTNHREEVLLLLYIPAILSLFLSPETIELQKNETNKIKEKNNASKPSPKRTHNS